MAATLAVLALLAVGLSDRYLPVVADWYTDMVIRSRTEAVHPYAMSTDEERAFYFCARSVVKRIENETSIVTFVGQVAGSTEVIGSGRYRIRSYVDESLEDGATRRHFFTCTTRYDGRGWILEDLSMESLVG